MSRIKSRIDRLEAERVPAARYVFSTFQRGVGFEELRQKERERLGIGPGDHHFVTVYGCRPEEEGKRPAKLLSSE
ncbi:MAG: hypothetical protein AAF844_05980, partial [Pseudomonadota bacterium]